MFLETVLVEYLLGHDQANILAKYMYQSIYDPDALKSELEQVFGQF